MAGASEIILRLNHAVIFTFEWRVETSIPSNVESAQATLAQIARLRYQQGLGKLGNYPDASLATVHPYEAHLLPVVDGKRDDRGYVRAYHAYAQIGEGRSGTVYKAVDLGTGKLWAVKTGKPEDWAQFKNEVEQLSELKHVRLRSSAHSPFPCLSILTWMLKLLTNSISQARHPPHRPSPRLDRLHFRGTLYASLPRRCLRVARAGSQLAPQVR